MQHYDVFISFKHLSPDGTLTRDSALASEVFQYLEQRGLSVFLSNVSLEKLGVAAYKRAIDDALDSAQVLIAIGTSLEHFDSQWVRYEWDSFVTDILSGVKPSGRVFTYIEGMDTASLPRALRQTQAVVHEPGAAERLYNFVANSLHANMPDQQTASTSAKPIDGERSTTSEAGTVSNAFTENATSPPAEHTFIGRFTVIPGRTIRTGFSQLMTVTDSRNGERRLLKQTLKERIPQPITQFIHLTVDNSSVAAPEMQWEDTEYCYEILPMVKGWTLAEIMALNKGVYGEILTLWCRLLLKIVRNLQQHAPPLIHRDIKPENIMLRDTTDLSSLVLIDCSAMISFPASEGVPVIGTPGYCAPEAMQGHPDLSSDLYSVGCTLYALNRAVSPPRATELDHFGEKISLIHEEHDVWHVFSRLVTTDPAERFAGANAALAGMIPSELTLTRVTYDDLVLPDGRRVPHGGWY